MTREPPPASSRIIHHANGRLRFTSDGLRYLVDDGSVLDVHDPDRISVTLGPQQADSLPVAFYGTVTAALLASRGHFPLHGSAVAFGDRAVLICGHSGAGKSTLTAALVGAGGRLISDDLSTVLPGSRPLLYAGRRAVRLFPDVAAMLEAAVAVERLSIEPRQKVLAGLPSADPAVAYPLAAILVLGEVSVPFSSPEAASLVLLEYSYRRRALLHLPRHAARLKMAQQVAAAVPMFVLPRVEARDPDTLRRVADDVFRVCGTCLA